MHESYGAGLSFGVSVGAYVSFYRHRQIEEEVTIPMCVDTGSYAHIYFLALCLKMA